MRERKYNFIPITQLGEKKKEDGHGCTFSVKGGSVAFSDSYVRDRGMEGAFLMFFYERQKKILAWRKVEGNELLSGQKWPQVRKFGKRYIEFISRKKGGPIDGMGLDRSKSYKKMAIRHEKGSLMTGPLDYIELR